MHVVPGMFALTLAASALSALSARAAEPPAKPSSLVSVGADYVTAPSIPEKFFLDARRRPVIPAWKPGDAIREIPRQFHGEEALQRNRPQPAQVAQPDPLVALQQAFSSQFGTRTFATPLVNEEGQGFAGVYPPDPSGDVGGGFYLQVINGGGGAMFTIYDTSNGNLAAGPFNMDGLGTGGACASGLGDGVVLFDQLAQRWLLTEFSSSSNTLCLYLSSTDNPVSTTWTRYTFTTPSFPDYPKYGVWPDAYYCGANEGPAVYAIDRPKMLAGVAATLQRKVVPSLGGLGFQMVVPASANGTTPPAAGSPGVFVRDNDDERNSPGTADPAHDFIELFTMHADFTTPANTTLTGPIQIQESEFDSNFTIPSGFGGIHQPGTSQLLDPLLEVTMFPFHYRNFGDHESLVGTHVTQLPAGGNLAGIRWFELRRSNVADPWTMYQEGTYAPADAGGQISRWMGAIGMDSSGNIALGYSVARATPAVYPGLRYVGRESTDSLGVMTTAESSLVEGGSSQTNFDRWGDYFQMGTDSVDGCTFWFTGMYEPAGGNWSTRIGSFRFDSCGTTSTFTMAGDHLTQSVCATSSAPTALTPITININALNGFNTPVAMSLVSLPTGFAGNFSPTPVTPPGMTTASLTATNAATPGNNTMTLRGSAASIDRDLTVHVNVATQAPPTVVLQAPADNAMNVSTQPIFTWISSDQAESYLIEIATDSAFTQIILSQTLASGVTSYQPTAALPNSTPIYWRVSATNICGDATAGTPFTFTTQSAPGECAIGTTQMDVYSDDIESGAGSWTHSAATGTDTWTINTDHPNSPSHSWFVQDPGAVSDQNLVSPIIAMPSDLGGLILSFQNSRDIEANSGVTTCYDGGILELAVDGGAFTQVPGSALITDPYTAAVSTQYSSPIAGLDAWCGQQAYTNSLVDVSAYAGHSVQFRFRMTSDSSVGKPGWYIDDVSVKGCSVDAPDDTIFKDGFDDSAP